MMDLGLTQIIMIGTGVLLLFVNAWLIASMYKKCGPNEAMIISGLAAGANGRSYKIIVGGGAVVLPLIQQKSVLSLEVMTLEIEGSAPIITKGGVPIFLKGVAQVKVKGNEDSIAIAAEQFLGKPESEISNIARESLTGHIRAVLANMTVLELIEGCDKFAAAISEKAAPDLAKVGLTVVSLTIKEISDNVGYLESLGKEQTAKAKKNAAIEQAKQNKEAAIAKMENEVALALIKELDVDPDKRSKMLVEYAAALPILEKSVDQHSSVFTDFLQRYALIYASGNDFISLGKAEELMQRVKSLKQPEAVANLT